MSKKILTLVIGLLTSLNNYSQDFPFKNPKLSIDDRVENLLSLLTLEEKYHQLRFDAPAIERLDIPSYNWWNECLHGVARNGKATIFPQAIGLGSTFDRSLMFRIGEAIALEARAKFNVNRKIDYRERYAGLTFWSPNVNLFRDPRWGRGQETYGEDPMLISELGVSFVKGLQGDGEILKTAAMAKHFAVHSGPEKLRHEFDAIVSRHDLWNTYLPAFKALVVDADVEGVMGAYNRTNGKPCNAHPYLMQEVLRDKWKFDGYFVSDCWALVDFFNGHNIVSTAEEAAAVALKNGCNLNCGSVYQSIEKALELNLVSEKEIDNNLKQLLPTRFKLGLFDPVGMHEMDRISTDVVRCNAHIALSYEAAKKSIVMLKNENDALPLDPDIQSVFVTGPMAANVQALLANYYGLSGDLKTILEGVVDNVSDHTAIRYVQGALMDRPNVNPIDWYSDEAREADVTIACMGISQLMEGEEGEAIASPSYGDRVEINLPEHQISFLRLLKSKAKKLIVVITGGSAISSPEVHDLADAILYAWYPGEQGGQAIGDIIFGKSSPSGRTPVTFVKTLSDLPPYEDYNMVNRTYKYLKEEALYPFGFGLGYADLQVESVNASKKEFHSNDKIRIAGQIRNRSSFPTQEVVQIYVKNKGDNSYNCKLVEFDRISVAANNNSSFEFELDDSAFSQYDQDGNKELIPGEYSIYVGTVSPFQRSLDLGGNPYIELNIMVKKDK